jgi:uncharacterized protein YkwD
VPVPMFLRSLGCVVAATLFLAPIASAACPGGNLVPTTSNLGAVRAAIVCLHSQVRAEHHLSLLSENARLRRAATDHSADMVSNRYFEHTTPSGMTLLDRLLSAAYLRRDQGYAVGENIAWASGSLATPASIMREWMASPGHRANILRRGYREVGVGIVTGLPSDGTAGATYTTDFGVRG